MLQAPQEAVGFCAAPTYWHTQKQWREFFKFCPAEVIVDINRSQRQVTLEGSRRIWFKSCDDPDSLRSEGLDVLWLDEGGEVTEEAHDVALMPALTDRKGKAIYTGTPKGKNWYFRLFTRGQDLKQTEYKSWQFSSYTNPYLDKKELERFKNEFPELAYRQEILGEALDDIGSVFRGIDEIVKGNLEAPKNGVSYVMGADLAKLEDFTVLAILDDNGHLCWWDRFSELDWVFQRKRLVNLCQRYNARLLIDSTGVGEPIYDELRREQLRVDGYKFTNASKKDLIENLSIAIENRQISIPNIPELINELKLYGYKKSPSGLTQYSAPEGYHDDCVIALALAAWMIRKPNKIEAGSGSISW